MPSARTAALLASSAHAMPTPEKARASSPNSVNFSQMARTAFTEVKTIHW